jgi:hypothetical protein
MEIAGLKLKKGWIQSCRIHPGGLGYDLKISMKLLDQ